MWLSEWGGDLAMRGGAKAAIVGGVFATVVTVVGYGAYNVLDDIGVTSASGSDAAAVGNGPPSADEVTETSRAFLKAWEAGDATKAADLTNNAAEASPALSGYVQEAHVQKVRLTAGSATGRKVPYSVTATVSYEGKTSEWTYESELTVVRGQSTGRALVDWKTTVLHPDLKPGESLRTGEAESAPINAVDHDGTELTAEKYPSLSATLDALRERYGNEVGGTPGIEVWAEPAQESASSRTLHVVTKGIPGTLPTTLDAEVQAAAEKAVKRYGESSVVAIQPSTGEIRAVANNREDGFNAAMQGTMAPGSTMKIVTASMLIDKGLVTSTGDAACPPTAAWGDRTFKNLNDFSTRGETFGQAFARSCNTAFIKLVDDVDDDAALSLQAQEVFGIGMNNWKTGISTFDGRVPVSSGAETAAAMIGQGQVQMNPLNMASITATVKAGSFKQPIIVPQSLDDRELAESRRPLSAGTAEQLRAMMRLTATSGYTGAAAMAGVGGDKGAKTGSAEVDGQSTSNSWFTGFSDDLAAAAVVQSGGHGGDTAGPLVAAVLNAG